MRVTVKFHGVFRIDRFKEESTDYPSGTSVQDIVDKFLIPENLLGIVLVNGAHGSVEDLLEDGDTLALLPILEGG
ncbi:MAG: MoaD/ThiS family protein [Desulfuromonadales bacterium]|nr:MoaD/ThiS family protein [Desulfuromonadales bacterium]